MERDTPATNYIARQEKSAVVRVHAKCCGCRVEGVINLNWEGQEQEGKATNVY